MKRRPSSTHVIAIGLFVAACVLGAWTQARQIPQIEVPRARFADGTPLGGKGLRLMLERMGYKVQRKDGVLTTLPRDARVWILLDPEGGFTRREADDVLKWVKDGGTLILSSASGLRPPSGFSIESVSDTGIMRLKNALNIANTNSYSGAALNRNNDPLPPLAPQNAGAASVYWSGVSKASGSDGGLTINRPHLELAGTPIDVQLARINYGKGRVFVAPDALIFTNYALSKPDTAVLISNLIRVHVPPSAAVYFDERAHGEDLQSKAEPNLLYYLWQPPLRYALLQLLAASLLLWILYGRRLGAAIPLPGEGPVTRASQFAGAMGALFRKAGRPRAAAIIIGENFRRNLTRRLGLSVADEDALIAARAAEATGYSSRLIDRLLLQAKAPDDDEMRVLADAQEMENILRSLDRR